MKLIFNCCWVTITNLFSSVMPKAIILWLGLCFFFKFRCSVKFELKFSSFISYLVLTLNYFIEFNKWLLLYSMHIWSLIFTFEISVIYK
jgi:hypothetical protein